MIFPLFLVEEGGGKGFDRKRSGYPHPFPFLLLPIDYPAPPPQIEDRPDKLFGILLKKGEGRGRVLLHACGDGLGLVYWGERPGETDCDPRAPSEGISGTGGWHHS